MYFILLHLFGNRKPLNQFQPLYAFYILDFIVRNDCRFDEALELLDSMIQDDETNASPRKRKIAILKAKGRTVEAIKELNEYLRK